MESLGFSVFTFPLSLASFAMAQWDKLLIISGINCPIGVDILFLKAAEWRQDGQQSWLP